MEIAFRFDEDVQIAMLLGEFTEKLLDVLHIDDVVDQSESCGVIAMRQVCHFLGDLLGRFGPKLHILGVEPAKGAMVFLAPPTAARALIEKYPV